VTLPIGRYSLKKKLKKFLASFKISFSSLQHPKYISQLSLINKTCHCPIFTVRYPRPAFRHKTVPSRIQPRYYYAKEDEKHLFGLFTLSLNSDSVERSKPPFFWRVDSRNGHWLLNIYIMHFIRIFVFLINTQSCICSTSYHWGMWRCNTQKNFFCANQLRFKHGTVPNGHKLSKISD